MDFGLQGKVAMVAAASKGIGFAIAQLLTQEGCRVSICGRNEETLEQATSQLGDEARSYVVDVSDAEDLAWWVEQTQQDLGPVDILVTNTGGPPAGPLDAISDEQWQSGFDSTLMNIVRLVRAVSPGMQDAGWGRIVHITSYVAKEPSRILPISSTLRSGLMALTRLQALELAPHGITVNGVLPGSTLTDRQRHLADIRAEREGISPEEALAKQGADVPIGRLAAPEEIAAAVAFLCSKPASYVTGTSLLVDGGLTRGLG
ncbi:SDR family oxidoreductase [Fimbriimonas ginsengisoli]|uniref:Short-chain dehydrogenase/reductase SDR n=1 Tax=Fimbriimonas ginsengisoli Gsoil 348 TaxID=661478 RepID=A0A068NYE0_FIMGI|nr:SDR family oxidoreductase [Fimbriimonas ginsengisoli]AIE86899.1 short-chain dehydrogenase/reductase SDR [Fimbriimonas ginsengisoli Gsoil 348]